MVIIINLLCIIISVCDVQAVKPQGCTCYDPKVLDSNNSTVACNTTNCSRGNNPDCYGDDDDNDLPSVLALRVFGVSTDFVDFLGCNCPGYNFSDSSVENAVGLESYSYTDCNGFGGESQDDDLIYCCNYCCGLLPVYTTTSVPSATSSIRSFPIYTRFLLAFTLIKMIELVSIELDFSI